MLLPFVMRNINSRAYVEIPRWKTNRGRNKIYNAFKIELMMRRCLLMLTCVVRKRDVDTNTGFSER